MQVRALTGGMGGTTRRCMEGWFVLAGIFPPGLLPREAGRITVDHGGSREQRDEDEEEKSGLLVDPKQQWIRG